MIWDRDFSFEECRVQTIQEDWNGNLEFEWCNFSFLICRASSVNIGHLCCWLDGYPYLILWIWVFRICHPSNPKRWIVFAYLKSFFSFFLDKFNSTSLERAETQDTIWLQRSCMICWHQEAWYISARKKVARYKMLALAMKRYVTRSLEHETAEDSWLDLPRMFQATALRTEGPSHKAWAQYSEIERWIWLAAFSFVTSPSVFLPWWEGRIRLWCGPAKNYPKMEINLFGRRFMHGTTFHLTKVATNFLYHLLPHLSLNTLAPRNNEILNG